MADLLGLRRSDVAAGSPGQVGALAEICGFIAANETREASRLRSFTQDKNGGPWPAAHLVRPEALVNGRPAFPHRLDWNGSFPI